MISALAWVRKGVAAEKPTRYEVTEAEYAKMQGMAAAEISSAKKELKKKSALDPSILNDPALKDFDLENYDTSESEQDSDDEGAGTGYFSNVKSLAFHHDGAPDPYLAPKGDGESDSEEDDEEAEEMRVFATDNMLLVAKTEDDLSNLEVCVFEPESDNLFVHHDFMLPSFPLCLEWMDYRVGRKAAEPGGGNYVAVGTFEPQIEIWDLDQFDNTYPDLVLGAPDKKVLRKSRGKPHADFHTDAVMGLSWNNNVRNLLASSSADTTVKLWDLAQGKCVQHYTHHKSKVQAVKWHPTEAAVMLTGGYDRRVAALDSRAPDAVKWWTVDADVESVMWDIHSPSHFYVATEAGTVRYFDVRTATSKGDARPVYTLVAHDEAVSAMDQHPHVAGLLMTGSADETVKVWDVRDAKPSMVLSRNLDVGNVFAARFCPDEPMLAAVAGSNGEARIWDLSTNATMRSVFGNAEVKSQIVEEKPLVGISREDDDDDENSEDERIETLAEMKGVATSADQQDNVEDNDDDEGDEDAAMESDSE
ncbi:rRNA-processing protein [Coemansia sp. Benny D115]|nr:rRNA-processing protein [Coemansia sp. Benny D115]